MPPEMPPEFQVPPFPARGPLMRYDGAWIDNLPASSSADTQRAITRKTYQGHGSYWAKNPEISLTGRGLDFGSGFGHGPGILQETMGIPFDSYEPFFTKGVPPTYSNILQVPKNAYRFVISNYNLNAIPWETDRYQALIDAAHRMTDDGRFLIRTRNDLGSAAGLVNSKGTFQTNVPLYDPSVPTFDKSGQRIRGLMDLVPYLLGDKYTVSPTSNHNRNFTEVEVRRNLPKVYSLGGLPSETPTAPPNTGMGRSGQRGFTTLNTPLAVTGAAANVGLGAYSSYLDALQHGATNEQAIEAAKYNAKLGAGFMTLAAAAPRLALPLASGLGGMDAANDAYHAATGKESAPGWVPTVGGALGLAALLDPMTAPLPIGYGGYKLLKPLAHAAFAHDYPTGVSETRQIKNRSAATQSPLAPAPTPMAQPVKEIKPLYESSGAKSTAKSVASGITEKRKSALSDKDQADIQKYLQSRPQSRPLRQNDAKKVFGGVKASGSVGF